MLLIRRVPAGSLSDHFPCAKQGVMRINDLTRLRGSALLRPVREFIPKTLRRAENVRRNEEQRREAGSKEGREVVRPEKEQGGGRRERGEERCGIYKINGYICLFV